MKEPAFIVMIYELHQRARHHTDKDLSWLAKKFQKYGVTHVRMAPFWDDLAISPYLKTGGDFDLTKPNPEYDHHLRRVVQAMHSKQIEIMFDLFCQCSGGRPFSPFAHNCNGVHGPYDYGTQAMKFWPVWIDRIMTICGPKRSTFGFNEPMFPSWSDVAIAHEWGRRWVLPITNIIKGKGRPPIYIGGPHEPRLEGWTGLCDGTASRMIEYMCQAGLRRHQLIHVIHGMGTPENWAKVRDYVNPGTGIPGVLSGRTVYGMSDDGVCKKLVDIPLEQRGDCETPGKCCNYDKETRIATVAAMRRDLKRNFVFIELMAKRIAMGNTSILDINVDLDCKIFEDIKRIMT